MNTQQTQQGPALFDQDQRPKLRERLTGAHWQTKTLAALLAAVLFAASIGVANASDVRWQPRQGCAYKIRAGDTLNRVGRSHEISVADIVAVNPHVTNPNRIFAGDVIDVCPPVVNDNRPRLVEMPPRSRNVNGVEVPQTAVRWAKALLYTMPDDASHADAQFLMAVAGPESGWCTNTWNPGDAGRGGWLGSYGCVQIRTNSNWAARNEPMRNLEWLQVNWRNQARAAWWIYQQPGWGGTRAWGPAKYARGIGVKLPPGGIGHCHKAARVAVCESYWTIGDAALSVALDQSRRAR